MAKHDAPTEFTVRGRGAFPVDMLRYDAAYPASAYDARQVERTFDERLEGFFDVWTITLQTRCATSPTAGRWHSFGWEVGPAPEVVS